MINRWFDIRWSIHPLFVLVMLASVVTGYFIELITLFVIVLVHELGHVLAARGFGWRVTEVKLLPFGGVAEVEELDHMPIRQELVVTLAGPMQNLWMGAAAWAMGEAGWISPAWAAHLIEANLMIGLFNLLPILPLDGGRLLQALISCRASYHRTLLWSARISLACSAAMVGAAFAPLARGGGLQMNLLVIGLFLLLTNWHHYRNLSFLFIRFLMRRNDTAERRLRRGEPAKPIIVSAGSPVLDILRLLRRNHYHLIYVQGGAGRELLVLPENRLVEGYLTNGQPGREVRELLR